MTPTRIVPLGWVFSDCARVIEQRPRRRIARVKRTMEAPFEATFEVNGRKERMVASSVQTPEIGEDRNRMVRIQAGYSWLWKWPLRNADAIALGTSASASTRLARLRATSAFMTCSWAIASERRCSAWARAMRTSASAWSARSRAPMFWPTSMWAISIETMVKAVWLSRPRLRTVRAIRFGFSRTAR